MEIEPSYSQLHEAVKGQCLAKEFFLKKKLSGKSGDSVYLCDIIITSPKYSGLAIIKYSTDQSQYAKNEFKAHELASESSPDFASKHIPKLLKHVKSNNKSAFIMSVVGDGLGLTEELASLTHDNQTRVMCLVSDLLLDHWDSQIVDEECSAQSVLSLWLDYRISAQSTLPALMEDVLSVSRHAETFYFSNKPFANPYHYATSDHSFLDKIKLRPIIGHMHGDLHGHNCLYGGHTGNNQNVFLIDFEQYKLRMPLFFDHAYLEFSLLLNNHTETSFYEWVSVINLLSNIEDCEESISIDLNGDMYARVRQIQSYRKNIQRWAVTTYKSRIEDVYTQMVLARIAVGLNFANKGRLADDDLKSSKMKVFAFLYAAENLNYLSKCKKLDLPEPTVIAQSSFLVPVEDDNALKAVWDECDYFSRQKANFALLAGKELGSFDTSDAKLLSSLPWKLVLDFDTQDEGILGKSKKYLSENIAWKPYFPEQIESNVETDILIWLSLNGRQLDMSSVYRSFKEWRRSVTKKLRILSEELARHTSVLPFNLLVIASDEDATKVEHVIQALDESLGDKLKVIVICNEEKDRQVYQELGEKLELEYISCIKCSSTDFVRSISQYYSLPSPPDKVLIPMANTRSNEPLKVEVPKELYAASSKCMTILHSGLTAEKTDIGQFNKGHKISWAELEQNLAINMAIDRKLETKAVAALRKNSYERCTIYHQAGGGGSTVIRKAAWRLKDDWPVLVITKNSSNIHEYVEQVAMLTNFPVMIVVDGSILTPTEKDRLISELKIRGVNHLLLESERGLRPANSKNSSLLEVPCPIDNIDGNIFYKYYKELAEPSRHSALKKLTCEPSMLEYRQPFFYGFYTFEDEFMSVESFVKNSTKNLTEERERLLLWVSLITRYSQEGLPITFLNVMLGKRATSVFRIKDEFGSNAAPLFLVQNHSVRVIHPIIAERLISKLIGKSEAVDYSGKLKDACINLVDSLGSAELHYEDKTGQILQGLFIARQSGGNHESAGKARFSELLKEINSPNKQHSLLKHLCDIFSEQAHYLSHFGRHINYDNSRNSAEAIPYFEKAIELDPESEIHFHGLAMVYSNLVTATIGDIKNNQWSSQGTRITATDVISRISANYKLSMEYFKRAYELSWKSEHALVSYTKLIQRAVEAIYWQSKPNDKANHEYKYCDFFKQNNTASSWCREALEEMEWAISELKNMQAESEISHYVQQTISIVPRFYDDKASLIEGLSSLIAGHNEVDHSNTRRVLASTYFKLHEESELSVKKLNKIVELMEENLTGGRGDARDIKHWFRAYRMLPDFSYSEAIDRIETWERLRNSIQATYYLYILHYFSYEQGVLTSQRKAKDYIEKCKRNIPISTTSKKSFEWVSANAKSTLPLINSNELGKWSGFFEYNNKLKRVKGMILSVENHVKGTIRINGFDAFFVPKNEFSTDDVNTEVTFYLGFSFEGLRAWKVEIL